MNVNSTPVSHEPSQADFVHNDDCGRAAHESGAHRIGPRPSTLAFIRQFARCYQPQPSLPYPLSAIVAN